MAVEAKDALHLARVWAEQAGSTVLFRHVLSPVEVALHKHAGLLAAAFELYDLAVSTPEGRLAAAEMGLLARKAEEVQDDRFGCVAHDAGHPSPDEGNDGQRQASDAVPQGFFARLFRQFVRKEPALDGGAEQLQRDHVPVVLPAFAAPDGARGMPRLDQLGSRPPVCSCRLVSSQHSQVGVSNV